MEEEGDGQGRGGEAEGANGGERRGGGSVSTGVTLILIGAVDA